MAKEDIENKTNPERLTEAQGELEAF